MFKIFTNIIFNRKLFKPDHHLSSITEISSNTTVKESLRNVKVLLFDKDDTLVPLYEFDVKDTKVAAVIDKLVKSGKKIYIISNSVREKGKSLKYISVQQNCQEIQLLSTKHKKPYNGEQLQQILKDKNEGKITNAEIAIIGDRKMTDIYLGKLQGWKTILVDPIQMTSVEKHGLGVFLMRKVESLL